ncbi:MAG: energy-coupling factor transporter transmembrane protein EcfT [Actinomycetia bacterium]|nr:energy-coupling factor transporter transmembrane protein EcfT [Actinomycetes bacterium]
MRGAFASTHPIVEISFFIFMVLITVLFRHPVLLGISFILALAYAIRLSGLKALLLTFAIMVPMMIGALLINVLFNHRGATMLFYLPDGNPFTLESLAFGAASSLMIGAVVLWFACYMKIMTSDKFLYLFSRIIPALSLVISMALRLVPRYLAQIRKIAEAQAAIGRGINSGNVLQRARHGLTILSVMVTWSLENGVETADSMYARGYGLPKRTAYSLFKFEYRDGLMLTAMAYLAVITIAGIALGVVQVTFFPLFSINPMGILPALFYLVFLLAAALPLIIDGYEALIWHSLKSSI